MRGSQLHLKVSLQKSLTWNPKPLVLSFRDTCGGGELISTVRQSAKIKM